MKPRAWVHGLTVAFFFLLPNILFFLAEWLGVGRSLVNIDYVLPVLLASLGAWRLALLIGVALVALDVLLLIMQVFPFIRFNDALYFLNIAHLASPLYQAILVGIIVVPCALMAVSVLYARRQSALAAMIFLNICLLGYAWTIHITPTVAENRLWRMMEQNVFGSAGLYFYEYRFNGFIQGHLKDNVTFQKAGFESVLEARTKERGGEDIILFIINESWGATVDPVVQERLLEPIATLPLRDPPVYGELEFFGATVAAELKELCGLRPDHFALKGVAEEFGDCLPQRYVKKGYETHAVHGAMGTIYDRKDWYPKAGFQQLTLFESVAWPRRCHSFPGACDVDIAIEVRKLLERNDNNKLIYWLTLNSHSLYDRRDLFLESDDCNFFGLANWSESCRNIQLQQQFFKVLVGLFEGYEGRDVQVIVVGDHVPPIIDQREKETVFKERTVPWIDFIVSASGVASTKEGWVRESEIALPWSEDLEIADKSPAQ